MTFLRIITVFTALLAAATAQCGAGLSICNGQCYLPAYNSCPTDQVTGKVSLCPPNFGLCNGGCYNPAQYHCANGGLQLGGAALPTSAAAATSTAAATPTSSSVAPAPTTSSQAAAATSSSSSSSSVSSSSCQAMFAQASCRTVSEDPTKVDPNAVAGARGWLCSNYPKYCTNILYGAQYGSCNNVEQLTYAMSLYYNDFQSQGTSACSFGGIAQPNTNTAASSTVAAPTPTTSAAISNCQAMYNQASCRTASNNVALVDANSVAGARGWLCSAYPQFCVNIQSGGQYSTCNYAEQLSNAMSLYYNNFLSQGPSACSFGGIAQINYNAGSATPSTVAPTTSAAAVAPSTSAAAVTPSTSAAPVATTSSSAAAVTPSTSATPVTTASSGSTCNSAGCGSGLCMCNGQCYSPSQYNCPADPQTGKTYLCYSYFQVCGGSCFDSKAYHCVNGVISQGAATNVPVTPSTVAPTPTTSAAASTFSAAATTNVVVNPSPAPSSKFPTQTADLRIINSCKSTLWFEARYGNGGAPIPGQTLTATQALPGTYVDYTVPATGLSGSRFWAKYGCDSNGRNCLVGDQMQYWPNPPGGCPANGCTPPVDSLFEATWGCRPGTSCNAANPTTWFDTSQVDGWTIPYKLTANGQTNGCDCIGSQCGFTGVDASQLDLSKCPRGENLAVSTQASVTAGGQTVSLSSVDLRIINNGSVLGCLSPCKRMNWGLPYGLGQPEDTGAALWMCCPTPTPDNCSPSNGCVSPTACRNGPIENTQYVAAVHAMAPGVYSYSYDDGVGLHACPAGVVTYTMEFCPTGSAPYPAPAN